MEIKAHGRLRHFFRGSYSAGVVLVFESAIAADAAAIIMGEPWKRSAKAHAIGWHGDSVALDALKVRLKSEGFALAIDPCGWGHCRDKCADAEIDSLAHSVDVGPVFTLVMECADPRQVSLF